MEMMMTIRMEMMMDDEGVDDVEFRAFSPLRWDRALADWRTEKT